MILLQNFVFELKLLKRIFFFNHIVVNQLQMQLTHIRHLTTTQKQFLIFLLFLIFQLCLERVFSMALEASKQYKST